jgi:hypothetical protein
MVMPHYTGPGTWAAEPREIAGRPITPAVTSRFRATPAEHGGRTGPPVIREARTEVPGGAGGLTYGIAVYPALASPSVPEPPTAVLLTLGAGGLMLYGRRRASRADSWKTSGPARGGLGRRPEGVR